MDALTFFFMFKCLDMNAIFFSVVIIKKLLPIRLLLALLLTQAANFQGAIPLELKIIRKLPMVKKMHPVFCVAFETFTS